MKKKSKLFSLVIIGILSIHSAYCQSGWEQQNSGVLNNLLDISFIDSTNGWVSGNNSTILSTNDGGLSWSIDQSGITNIPAIDFINSSTGWCLFGSTLICYNSGWDWSDPCSGPSSFTAYDFEAISQSSIWVVGSSGSIMKLGVGMQTSGTSNSLRCIQCIDNNSCWIAGANGTILNINNGGSVWTQQTSGLSNNLNGIFFIDDNNGWIVGTGGKILHTNNGGSSWTEQTSGISTQLNSVWFADSLTGWAVGNSGKILFTPNGGVTWFNQISGTIQNLNKVQFANKREGWVVGSAGVILHTVNSGININISSNISNVSCYGLNDGAIDVSVSHGFMPYSYSWSNSEATEDIFGLTADTYTITITDNAGNQDSLTFNVTQPPTLYAIIINSSSAHCGIADGFATATGSGGTAPYSYSWNNGQSDSIAISLTEGDYSVIVTDTNNCVATTSETISTSLPIPVPVCQVTVDSSSTHNIIYWEKPVTVIIDTFYIYREITSNNFVKIASVPYDSLNEYHDYAAAPNVTSYKYKVSVLDTCGFESAESDYHNTIHLQNLGSGSLQWTLYDIENAGNPVTYYRVYRDDVGNGNFQPISSTIPGSNSTYTDVNYSSFPNALYVVDVTWNISCTPYRSSVTTTRSNTWSPLTVGLESELENSIKIYPNPASQQITIEIPNSLNVLNLKIYNVLGVVVYDDATFDKTKKQINVENFAKGIYTLEVNTELGKVLKKMIVQ